MSRLGAILIPLLGGFLLTVAVVSWRSGWWQQSGAFRSPAAATPKVEPRRSPLRVAHVTLSAAPQRAVTPLTSLQAQRVNPESSPGVLEAPVRKFARGSKASGN